MLKNKIKILSVVRNPSFLSGGMETYNRTLAKVFSDDGKYEFVEGYFASKKSISKRAKINSEPIHKLIDIGAGKSTIRQKNAKNYIENNIKNGSYDIVIIHVADLSSKYILNCNKVIKMQHFDFDEYNPKKYGLFNKIGLLFSRMLDFSTKGNVLETHQNAVFFTESSNKSKKCTHPFYINTSTPLDVDFKREISKRSGGVMITRIMDIEHKGFNNLKDIIQFSKSNNTPASIDIYGTGFRKAEKKVGKMFGKHYIGKFDRHRINIILNSYKYYIMTSNFEGMPITLSEAMSTGLPVILLNTFTTVDLFKNCPSVFVFEKGNWNGVINKINEIESMNDDQWLKLSDMSLKFANENLSFESFKSKWLEVIATILSRQENN